ncbi:Glycerol-3-phosphate cytidylyltransferase [Ruminococcus flavefaciens]|uniref:Glycerol-3-phosphate dehydrogenase [NAD(P)+] n=1 Tax=Ruminococcus flavefaciens TaxID=1265 RepID=A0A1H6JQQ2_RUMFL|nr:glycerol-3-phosphate cytidylyltransferase [Ruminococcus flavefaciens]SEH64794.1 Glycerol-3-phosphate cytidylyltransferase [Ruminococcus flavefaciens]
MNKIGILGAGTWGIALARMLCLVGNDVQVWSALPDEIIELQTLHKHKNLYNVVIPDSINFTADITKAVKDKDMIIFAVPSIYVRSTAKMVAPLYKGEIIVDVAKGIESDSLMTMSEVIKSEIPKANVVALSGPTHAEEVALDLPTTIVSACEDMALAEYVQSIFSTPSMRVYTNTDIKGVEICGALKNIIALASGIASGMGFGDNTRAALITRGLSEIERLGLKMGCLPDTFSGLAGIGDLIVTSTSNHSRNNKCGYLIGQGYSPSDAVKQVGMVVEGINAIPAAIQLSEKNDVELPLIFAVDDIINHAVEPLEAVKRLMGRNYKSELRKYVIDINYESAVLKNTSIRVKGDQSMKRVITYGTFDLLHYGHINLLRRAKALGDYLIVVISSDEFNWNEKHKKCYFTYEQRKALVEAIRYVDLVIPEESWNQKRTDMHEYHIDTFVMGDDWKGKFDFLKEEGVDVVYLPRTPEISSSKMKKDLYDANAVDGESKTNHDDINTDPK